IINVPKRGSDDTTVGRIQQFADQEGISLFEAMRRVEEIEDVSAAYARRVTEFTQLILDLRQAAEGMPLTGLVDKLLRDTGYIAELQAEKSVEAEARIENLQEFLSVTKEFETQVESSIDAFLDR